MGPSFLSLG